MEIEGAEVTAADRALDVFEAALDGLIADSAASGAPAGIRQPASPSTSRVPPESVATTMRSQAMASATASPKPSLFYSSTKTSPALRYPATSATEPTNFTQSFRTGSNSVRPSRPFLSGPSRPAPEGRR